MASWNIYSALKFGTCYNIDGLGDFMLSEVNKTQKEILYDLNYKIIETGKTESRTKGVY